VIRERADIGVRVKIHGNVEFRRAATGKRKILSQRVSRGATVAECNTRRW